MAVNKPQPQTTGHDPLLTVYIRLIKLAEEKRRRQAETAGKRPETAEQRPGEK